MEPAERVLGVVVSFMESIAEALTADMDSGAAMERQQREGVVFADVLSEDEGATAFPAAANASDYLGSACDSLSQMSGDTGVSSGGAGGGYSSAANRSETQEAPTCWMELAVHYFLEIVDVLLDVALYLPDKPMIIYQLTVSASRMPSLSTDFLDATTTVGLAGLGSPPISTTDYHLPAGATTEEENAGGSALGRFQTFLSRYTSTVLQSAVTRFTMEGVNMPASMVAARVSSTNTPATTGFGEETVPRTTMNTLLASVAASLTPVALEDIAFSSARPGTAQHAQQQQPQPPLTSRPTGSPASVMAEPFSRPSGFDSAVRSTMWWPKARFQRYHHLVRVLEHAQLLCLYLNTPCGDELTPSMPILSLMERAGTAARHGGESCLRVSAVTTLLNTSTGPCAQLLSVPYACPPLAAEANSCVSCSTPSTSCERKVFHSPLDQPHGRYNGGVSGSTMLRPVLSDRVLREVCGGLWIRVEVLQLLRFASAPLDSDSFASFTKMAAEISRRLAEKQMQAHYKAVAGVKAAVESVLPKSYASTYVRLLFLRYVQAFYADMRDLRAKGQAVGGSPANFAGTPALLPQDHTAADRTETSATANVKHLNNGSYCSPSAIHTGTNNGETTTRSAVSPRSSPPLTSPLQDLCRRLWTQYCYQLLWALRDLCWNSTDAHETANNLSIASVYGRLLQMIGGRPNKEEYEDEFEEDSENGESLFDGPDLHLGEADMTTIITFDQSLAPYCTTKGGKPEDFADFESASDDSESSEAATASPPPLVNPMRKSVSVTEASRGDGRVPASSLSSKSSTPPPSSGAPVHNGPTLISVNVNDLTTLQSLEHKHSNEMSSLFCSFVCEDGKRAAPAAPPPPALPHLSLTGLKPPLYFASSGDTAAAQEDDHFKEQSKQRQKAEELEERRHMTSVSVVDANSYVSEADDGEEEPEEEEFENLGLSSASPKWSSQNASLSAARQGRSPVSKRGQSDVPDAFPQGGSAGVEATPKPPRLTIPKLSLGSLGPPMYFTSAGDTGVFAEVNAAGLPARSSGPIVPAINFNPCGAFYTGGGSPRPATHVDPAAYHPSPGNNTETYPTKTSKTNSLPPPPSLSPPVPPSVPTMTVEGRILPKLLFGTLSPPMYFTSSGDTGGFVEAQNAAPTTPVLPVTTTVSGVALPKSSLGSLGPPIYCTSSGDTGGFFEAHNETNNMLKSPAGGRTTTATALSRNNSQVSTGTVRFRSGIAARRAPHAAPSPEGGSTPANTAAGANRYRDFSSSDDTDSRDVRGSTPDNDFSIVSSATPEREAVRQADRHKKVTRRSPRLSVTPVVAPVVTMELILSLCSIILQRDSGMIQYAYTVSSLTQKRVLPGVSASQRRWLNTGNNMSVPNMSSVLSPKSVFSNGAMGAGQADNWRYTPQHSPSSFHVIQSLHNYLKDPRNTFVVDLLEEWVLDEYAAMERTRMEQFEADFGPQKREGRAYTLFFSPTPCRNSHGVTNEAASRYTSPISMGRFVLLRLLLPRAITHLVIPPNERRIGAGGYGSVTSGTVNTISNAATVLPDRWGRRGCHWRPTPTTKASSGTAHSASGSPGFGAKSPVSPERAMESALDHLRTPWRVAVYRTAQAVCGCDVAIKHLPLSAQSSESGNLPVCHAEVLAMYRLHGHPHIVPLLSFDNTKDEYVLIMPNYTLGSLRVWRQKHYQLGYAVLSLPSEANEPRKSASVLQRPLSSLALSSSLFATCARCLLQVLEAVVFMHERHIRHGDIKCDNVLIDKADLNSESKLGPPCVPLSVRLCDFGSCDACDDDDIRNLKNDIMAGPTRFMAGRWGVGRGTEAVQPPEVMSAKRRYTLFHRIMATSAVATASTAFSFPAPLERTDRGPYGSSSLALSADQGCRTRTTESMEGVERALTERLRRAELSVDIWACGCLLYEMFTGRMLFGEARLGRLLVLAAADDEAGQSQPAGWRSSSAPTVPRLISKAAASTSDDASATHQAAPPSTPSTRHALDEWERHDLENAVGTQVVGFMSCLLDLDPLQRPSAAEALYRWKEILFNMGFDV